MNSAIPVCCYNYFCDIKDFSKENFIKESIDYIFVRDKEKVKKLNKRFNLLIDTYIFETLNEKLTSIYGVEGRGSLNDKVYFLDGI